MYVKLFLHDHMYPGNGYFKQTPARYSSSSEDHVADVQPCSKSAQQPKELHLNVAHTASVSFPGHPIAPGQNMYGTETPNPQSLARQSTNSSVEAFGNGSDGIQQEG
jgi:hypothetical protein